MLDYSTNIAESNSRAGFADQFLKVNLFRKGFMDYDQFDEPTYLSFYIDFDFDGVMEDPLTSLPASPLFAENMTNAAELRTSAAAYLDQKYSPAIGQYIREFKTVLRYITNNTPWYFQSLGGLDKLWNNITGGLKHGHCGGTSIKVGCLEAIDLRLLHLAEFYSKAAYDVQFMRNQLTDNLRHFNMKIYVGEIRDIYSISPGVYSNPTGADDLIVGVARNITGRPAPSQASASDDSNQFRMNGLYFVEFNCFQCEFDFSDIFSSTGSKLEAAVGKDPFATSFEIKIGRCETKAQFGASSYSSNLYRDKYLRPEDKAAVSAHLADNITSAQRRQLQRENFTLEKLAGSLGPLSQRATSSLLGIERVVNNIVRIPNSFINSALHEVQHAAERGSLGNIYPNRP